ncbi:hypothetical protein SAMN05216226_1054 [Halovenus aranensis]|uniref:Uncharacterized protein n=1 Tax=Halovenus aranensis TaxID=890420 RepID=A0A1G8UMA6_9EURY|nr:hypothetical protein [Halovenus aranensis]SDJ54901.1 hypothetical protein SAMN05216226_1054 [Halovenus aranensis]
MWDIQWFNAVILYYTVGLEEAVRVVEIFDDIDNTVEDVSSPATLTNCGRSGAIAGVWFDAPQAKLLVAFWASIFNLRIHIATVYLDCFRERLVFIEYRFEC